VGLGYSFGSVDTDRDFNGYRSEGGIYLNISLKLNELLGGFGLQKPVPKQQQESEILPTAQSNPATEPQTPQSKLIQRLKQTQALLTPQQTELKKSTTKLINTLKKLQAFRKIRGGLE
jgi:hypothetical protein